MAEFRTIHLHGSAREQFGGPYRLAVDTPRDAIRLLIRQKPGFRKMLEQADWRVVRGPIGCGVESNIEMLWLRMGSVQELHLIPVASGAGRGKGIGKAIAGVAMAVAAVAFAIPSGGTSLAVGATAATSVAAAAAGGTTLAASLGATAFLGITYAQIAITGIGLALSGVAQLLAPNPKVAGYGDREQPDQRPSFIFNGPVNNAEQGAVVPVVLGVDVECGSVVGAAGIYVEELPV